MLTDTSDTNTILTNYSDSGQLCDRIASRKVQGQKDHNECNWRFYRVVHQKEGGGAIHFCSSCCVTAQTLIKKLVNEQ